MNKVGLLDVNVLVALLVPSHPHHTFAKDWLYTHGVIAGWATCPVTELGAVRVCALTKDIKVEPLASAVAIRQLRHRTKKHAWWAESPGKILEVRQTPIDRVRDHLTDNYLLGLARRQRGCLITCDRNLAALGNAEGRQDALYLLPDEETALDSASPTVPSK